MPNRFIVNFPRFTVLAPIHCLRDRFAPLATLIPPHLTVGRVMNPVAFRRAGEEAPKLAAVFETVVDEPSVHTIHPDGRHEIELTVPLQS